MNYYRKYLMVGIFIFISTILSAIDAYSETKPNKAIIVAGGGLYHSNNIFQFIANKAYKTLLHLNYTKDQIYFLGQDMNVDSDENGEFDDIDDLATLGHLARTISSWSQDAHNLVIFIVGNGGPDSFQINEREFLSASEIDEHIDVIQTSALTGDVIFIYDAGNSGTFIPALIPPTNKDRLLITSCAENESARFGHDGKYSFSYFFWALLWENDDISDAFNDVGRLLNAYDQNQNPQVDSDGNGITNETSDMIPFIGISQQIKINPAIRSSVDSSNLDWFMTDEAEWFIQSEYSFFNGSSAQSPALKDLESASLNTKIIVTGALEFYWKVSSEQEYDFLSFYINDSEKSRISGETGWQHQSYSLSPGEHKIKWTYAKDKSVSRGVDAGWLDKVEFRYDTIQDPSKAIIIAPATDDFFSVITTRLANYAYNILLAKGFSKENIFFLGPDTDVDIDRNGLNDDVDANVTIGNLHNAINYWAKENLPRSLTIYMSGHGGIGRFLLNQNEILNATDLDIWLDNFQQTIESKVLLVIDSAISGSFIPLLLPPIDHERIVITSCLSDEPSWFINGGILSFSYLFWSSVLDTTEIDDSWDYAMHVMREFQTAALDANGNGIHNEKYDMIDDFSFEQLPTPSLSLNDALDSVDLKYLTGGSASWFKQSNTHYENGTAAQSGLIDHNQDTLLETKIKGPGMLKFHWKVSSEQNYDFLNFYIDGITQTQISGEVDWQQQIYNIPFGTHTLRWKYIKDKGLTGESDAGWLDKLEFIPDQIVMPNKAIIVAGGGPYARNLIWEQIELCAGKAYRILSRELNQEDQEDNDNVYYLNPTGSKDVDGDSKNDIDAAPTIQNLTSIIYEEINETPTTGIVIYLVGHGGYDKEKNIGSFELSDFEKLSTSTLNQWLNDLPEMPGPVILIVDACESASFFRDLNPSGNNKWVIITSAGELDSLRPSEVRYEDAIFLGGGRLSFSYQFWSAIHDGARLSQAFDWASGMMEIYQEPQIDGNGNGVPNEEKVEQVNNIYIVKGSPTAAAIPFINKVGVIPDTPLAGENSATLWAKINSLKPLDRVWAVIVPPSGSQISVNTPIIYYSEVELEDLDGDETYHGTYNKFSSKGIYKVAIYASNEDGYYSLPGQISVEQTVQVSCQGDSDGDEDVDGEDIVDYVLNQTDISLNDFIAEFGKINCPN